MLKKKIKNFLLEPSRSKMDHKKAINGKSFGPKASTLRPTLKLHFKHWRPLESVTILGTFLYKIQNYGNLPPLTAVVNVYTRHTPGLHYRWLKRMEAWRHWATIAPLRSTSAINFFLPSSIYSCDLFKFFGNGNTLKRHILIFFF